jgi:hypothetical protein
MAKITKNQWNLIVKAGYAPVDDGHGPVVICAASSGTGDIWSDSLACGSWESLAYWTNNYELCGCGRHNR